MDSKFYDMALKVLAERPESTASVFKILAHLADTQAEIIAMHNLDCDPQGEWPVLMPDAVQIWRATGATD